MFVDVEFVIVPFATLIEGRDRFVIERLVIVALVKVALVPRRLVRSAFDADRFVVEKLVDVELVRVALVDVRYEVDAVKIFPVEIFEVEAFVVEAFNDAKLAVVPNKVPIVAEVKLAIAA